MFATIQMTHLLAAAILVTALAITAAFALSRFTETRIYISPLVPLTCWLVAGSATWSISFMLSEVAEWLVTTYRILGGLGVCSTLVIMYLVWRSKAKSDRAANAILMDAKRAELFAVTSSPGLPPPYVTGRGARLPEPHQREGLPLPYVA